MPSFKYASVQYETFTGMPLHLAAAVVEWDTARREGRQSQIGSDPLRIVGVTVSVSILSRAVPRLGEEPTANLTGHDGQDH